MWNLSELTLTHPHATTPALRHVNVRIEPGEQVVVLGSSGAGKSTLLRCLAGDLPPAGGQLFCDDTDVYKNLPARSSYQRRVAIIRQTGDLVPRLTARSNVLLAVSPKWRAFDAARVWLNRPTRFDGDVQSLASHHGVAHLLATPVERLSGGERQRVALLQALLRSPRLILADEPTAGLDPQTAVAACDALKRVEDVTLIVATHDLTVASGFARMIALKHGQVVHDGAPLDATELDALYAKETAE